MVEDARRSLKDSGTEPLSCFNGNADDVVRALIPLRLIFGLPFGPSAWKECSS